MMAHWKFVLCGAAGLAVAGCTGSTDPTTATLFDNINNLNSGEYSRQIAKKEAEAASIVAANNQRRSQIASLQGQQASNAKVIASLRAEIAAVQQQASAVKAKVASDPAKLSQINSLQAQLVSLRSDADAGADASTVRSELGRIRSAISALAS